MDRGDENYSVFSELEKDYLSTITQTSCDKNDPLQFVERNMDFYCHPIFSISREETLINSSSLQTRDESLIADKTNISMPESVPYMGENRDSAPSGGNKCPEKQIYRLFHSEKEIEDDENSLHNSNYIDKNIFGNIEPDMMLENEAQLYCHKSQKGECPYQDKNIQVESHEYDIHSFNEVKTISRPTACMYFLNDRSSVYHSSLNDKESPNNPRKPERECNKDLGIDLSASKTRKNMNLAKKIVRKSPKQSSSEAKKGENVSYKDFSVDLRASKTRKNVKNITNQSQPIHLYPEIDQKVPYNDRKSKTETSNMGKVMNFADQIVPPHLILEIDHNKSYKATQIKTNSVLNDHKNSYKTEIDLSTHRSSNKRRTMTYYGRINEPVENEESDHSSANSKGVPHEDLNGGRKSSQTLRKMNISNNNGVKNQSSDITDENSYKLKKTSSQSNTANNLNNIRLISNMVSINSSNQISPFNHNSTASEESGNKPTKNEKVPFKVSLNKDITRGIKKSYARNDINSYSDIEKESPYEAKLISGPSQENFNLNQNNATNTRAETKLSNQHLSIHEPQIMNDEMTNNGTKLKRTSHDDELVNNLKPNTLTLLTNLIANFDEYQIPERDINSSVKKQHTNSSLENDKENPDYFRKSIKLYHENPNLEKAKIISNLEDRQRLSVHQSLVESEIPKLPMKLSTASVNNSILYDDKMAKNVRNDMTYLIKKPEFQPAFENDRENTFKVSKSSEASYVDPNSKEPQRISDPDDLDLTNQYLPVYSTTKNYDEIANKNTKLSRVSNNHNDIVDNNNIRVHRYDIRKSNAGTMSQPQYPTLEIYQESPNQIRKLTDVSHIDPNSKEIKKIRSVGNTDASTVPSRIHQLSIVHAQIPNTAAELSGMPQSDINLYDNERTRNTGNDDNFSRKTQSNEPYFENNDEISYDIRRLRESNRVDSNLEGIRDIVDKNLTNEHLYVHQSFKKDEEISNNSVKLCKACKNDKKFYNYQRANIRKKRQPTQLLSEIDHENIYQTRKSKEVSFIDSNLRDTKKISYMNDVRISSQGLSVPQTTNLPPDVYSDNVHQTKKPRETSFADFSSREIPRIDYIDDIVKPRTRSSSYQPLINAEEIPSNATKFSGIPQYSGNFSQYDINNNTRNIMSASNKRQDTELPLEHYQEKLYQFRKSIEVSNVDPNSRANQIINNMTYTDESIPCSSICQSSTDEEISNTEKEFNRMSKYDTDLNDNHRIRSGNDISFSSERQDSEPSFQNNQKIPQQIKVSREPPYIDPNLKEFQRISDVVQRGSDDMDLLNRRFYVHPPSINDEKITNELTKLSGVHKNNNNSDNYHINNNKNNDTILHDYIKTSKAGELNQPINSSSNQESLHEIRKSKIVTFVDPNSIEIHEISNMGELEVPSDYPFIRHTTAIVDEESPNSATNFSYVSQYDTILHDGLRISNTEKEISFPKNKHKYPSFEVDQENQHQASHARPAFYEQSNSKEVQKFSNMDESDLSKDRLDSHHSFIIYKDIPGFSEKFRGASNKNNILYDDSRCRNNGEDISFANTIQPIYPTAEIERGNPYHTKTSSGATYENPNFPEIQGISSMIDIGLSKQHVPVYQPTTGEEISVNTEKEPTLSNKNSTSFGDLSTSIISEDMNEDMGSKSQPINYSSEIRPESPYKTTNSKSASYLDPNLIEFKRLSNMTDTAIFNSSSRQELNIQYPTIIKEKFFTNSKNFNEVFKGNNILCYELQSSNSGKGMNISNKNQPSQSTSAIEHVAPHSTQESRIASNEEPDLKEILRICVMANKDFSGQCIPTIQPSTRNDEMTNNDNTVKIKSGYGNDMSSAINAQSLSTIQPSKRNDEIKNNDNFVKSDDFVQPSIKKDEIKDNDNIVKNKLDYVSNVGADLNAHYSSTSQPSKRNDEITNNDTIVKSNCGNANDMYTDLKAHVLSTSQPTSMNNEIINNGTIVKSKSGYDSKKCTNISAASYIEHLKSISNMGNLPKQCLFIQENSRNIEEISKFCTKLSRELDNDSTFYGDLSTSNTEKTSQPPHSSEIDGESPSQTKDSGECSINTDSHHVSMRRQCENLAEELVLSTVFWSTKVFDVIKNNPNFCKILSVYAKPDDEGKNCNSINPSFENCVPKSTGISASEDENIQTKHSSAEMVYLTEIAIPKVAKRPVKLEEVHNKPENLKIIARNLDKKQNLISRKSNDSSESPARLCTCKHHSKEKREDKDTEYRISLELWKVIKYYFRKSKKDQPESVISFQRKDNNEKKIINEKSNLKKKFFN